MYEQPVMEIIELSTNDVVTTSEFEYGNVGDGESDEFDGF